MSRREFIKKCREEVQVHNWFIIAIGILQLFAAYHQFKTGSWKMGAIYLMYGLPNFLLATIK